MMVIPLPVPASPRIEANPPPIAPAINERKNGLRKRKFTPKIAGSVIPRKAERAAGKASVFSFGFFVLTPTATVAAP
ncbi:Uncharacterised protein [Streptococcus pneumoniae]|nr:Uncharacterised protein [Streptococcus pneumoniae]CIV97837.1 Uncharacterised protein [Streptococcus pneumoniae]CJG23163.1 Uncharacterised protein [Streptococcus pneumoniae]COK77176.1 Uncharacterised protein [Streptococcus pneumoniae]